MSPLRVSTHTSSTKQTKLLLDDVLSSEAHHVSKFIMRFLSCITGRSVKERDFDMKVQTILLNIKPESSTILIALKYVHKFVQRFPPSVVNGSFGIFRLFLAAIIHADITQNDNAFSIGSWQKVSGESKAIIVKIRREFVSALSFDMFVSIDEYAHWTKTIEKFIGARRKASGADTLPSPELEVLSKPLQ
jgi:glycyl-tRNA synthetase (class II)